ncbi:MAG TPA: 2OG-Fe(II) oxygenase [Thermoanaerobaculia bacterium]
MFTIPDFFDAATRAQLLAELRAATVTDATVYGGAQSVDLRVRRTKHVSVSDATRALVIRKLEEQRAALARHFEQSVDEIETPQFLRYTAGDFFVAHQDGNTPLIRDETRFRKISIVIFISPPGDYEGGELLLHGRYPDYELRERAPADSGTLIAFRAETTHEVTPLTAGERYTIVSWYRLNSTP